MLLDNIVRNRGAITWPWQHYARQGNNLFVFLIILFLISLAVIVPIGVIGLLMALPLIRHHHWPVGAELGIFILLGLAYLAFAVVFSVAFFIFRAFGIPLMFRNGLTAWAAFIASMKLFQAHIGSMLIFILLRIALFLALAVVSVIICCATCCIGTLPYIGTVVLLPAIIYIRCFTLDCLAQFGPEYDVWTVDVPPPVAEPLKPPATTRINSTRSPCWRVWPGHSSRRRVWPFSSTSNRGGSSLQSAASSPSVIAASTWRARPLTKILRRPWAVVISRGGLLPRRAGRNKR